MSWKDLGKAVARFAPLLGTALGGPAGAALGGLVASVVGGDPTDPAELTRRVQADPEAAVKLRKIESDERVRLQSLAVQAAQQGLAAETARIIAVNETMRAEAGADDPWTRRWRPFWGYMSAAAFFLQVGAIAVLMFTRGAEAAEMIASLGALSVFWGVPLAILGVSAWHRGVEKRIRAGEATPGLAGLVSALKR